MMYAFAHWGWIPGRWTNWEGERFWGFLKSYLLIGYIDIPLDYARNVLKAFEQSHVYTTENVGFMWFFNIVVDPILWVLTEWQMKENLMGLPQVMIWYLVDKSIFIDTQATRRDGKPRPRPGLATDIAKRYQITAMLFGDYTYLNDRYDLKFDIVDLIILVCFNIAQFFFSFFFDAAIIYPWAGFSFSMLVGVTIYEVFVLGYSFD